MPVCYNHNCKSYKKLNSTSRDERSKSMKHEQQYVWLDAEGYVKGIVTDLTKLYHAKPTTRENASGYRTPFENRD